MRPTGVLPTASDNHRIPRERSDTRCGGQCPRGGCGAQRREEYFPAAVFPIPIGSLGFPASPRLPPARKSPPGVPQRKVALSLERDESMQSCPRNDPPGTRASLSGAPERPACPWGDTRTRKHRLGGRIHSPRPVATGRLRPLSRETPPEEGPPPMPNLSSDRPKPAWMSSPRTHIRTN